MMFRPHDLSFLLTFIIPQFVLSFAIMIFSFWVHNNKKILKLECTEDCVGKIELAIVCCKFFCISCQSVRKAIEKPVNRP